MSEDPSRARIMVAQMAARPATSVDALLDHVAFFMRAAADLKADFLVLPEHFSLMLPAGRADRLPMEQIMASVAHATPALVDGMRDQAKRFGVNLIGGSHATTAEGGFQNIAYACLRNGRIVRQPKLHVTPDERAQWALQGGAELSAFETDCGPVAMLVCYDSEFPELVRHVADQGARLLFVPYATDTRHGHLRVTLCCRARAIENQIFVAAAGIVGALPNVDNMDFNYAQSGIYTPCDFGFPPEGVAVEAEPQAETAVTADVDFTLLARIRAAGSVRNLVDRRLDLYHVDWSTQD